MKYWLGLSLVLLIFTGCGPVYMPSRVSTPSVETKGDLQIDLDTDPQIMAHYAVTDNIILTAMGRSARTSSSSSGDPSRADKSNIQGMGLGVGYQRRVKSHRLIKYALLGGASLENWDGQVTRDFLLEEDVTINGDLFPFKTQLAVPYGQFLIGYGGRYTHLQLGVRGSYLMPFSTDASDELNFSSSTLIDYSLTGQVSLVNRLSFFTQVVLHHHMNDDATYFVLPGMMYLGLSYSVGSDGSVSQFK